MVNLITEKALSIQTASKTSAVKSSDENSHKKVLQVKDDTLSFKNLALPVAMLGTGGVLFYLGFRSSGKMKFFDEDVANRIEGMRKAASDCGSTIIKIIRDAFTDSKSYSAEYLSKHRLQPVEFVSRIVSENEPRKILEVQNEIFKTLHESSESFKPGASYIDEFGMKIIRDRNNIFDRINGVRHKTKQVLYDYAQVLPFKKNKHSDVVNVAKEKLNNLSENLGQMLDEKGSKFVNDEVDKLYRDMSSAVSQVRASRTNTKIAVINAAFKKFRENLGLGEEFKPSFDVVPTLERFSKLSKEELGQIRIPKLLQGDYADNIYIKFVQDNDFSKLKKEDITRFLARLSYDDSLRDLGFLIDRMRLEEVVAAEPDAKVFGNIIAKLEYLSNKLNEITYKDLTEKCGQSFDGILSEKNRANLYSIYNLARRCGYETIEDLCENFVKNNPKLESSDLKKYVEIIKNNPEIYFF